MSAVALCFSRKPDPASAYAETLCLSARAEGGSQTDWSIGQFAAATLVLAALRGSG